MKKNNRRKSEKGAPAGPTPQSIAREKQKAKDLRNSNWWANQLQDGVCHYCGKQFPPEELTMDHLVPLSRGGKSTKGNLVPACQPCNSDKKYYTPAEMILRDKMNQDIQF